MCRGEWGHLSRCHGLPTRSEKHRPCGHGAPTFGVVRKMSDIIEALQYLDMINFIIAAATH